MLRYKPYKLKRQVRVNKRRFIPTQESIFKNVKTVGNELKNKKDELIQISTGAAIDNLLDIMKTTEDKIKKNGMHGIEIGAYIMIGPVGINLSKKQS
jgi:hypothetical protein